MNLAELNDKRITTIRTVDGWTVAQGSVLLAAGVPDSKTTREKHLRVFLLVRFLHELGYDFSQPLNRLEYDRYRGLIVAAEGTVTLPRTSHESLFTERVNGYQQNSSQPVQDVFEQQRVFNPKPVPRLKLSPEGRRLFTEEEKLFLLNGAREGKKARQLSVEMGIPECRGQIDNYISGQRKKGNLPPGQESGGNSVFIAEHRKIIREMALVGHEFEAITKAIGYDSKEDGHKLVMRFIHNLRAGGRIPLASEAQKKQVQL